MGSFIDRQIWNHIAIQKKKKLKRATKKRVRVEQERHFSKKKAILVAMVLSIWLIEISPTIFSL